MHPLDFREHSRLDFYMVNFLKVVGKVTSILFQEEELNNNRGEERVRTPVQKPSRTGWPQHVWALELKQ